MKAETVFTFRHLDWTISDSAHREGFLTRSANELGQEYIAPLTFGTCEEAIQAMQECIDELQAYSLPLACAA